MLLSTLFVPAPTASYEGGEVPRGSRRYITVRLGLTAQAGAELGEVAMDLEGSNFGSDSTSGEAGLGSGSARMDLKKSMAMRIGGGGRWIERRGSGGILLFQVVV
ncbi:hypothetical protein GUJ93_ZPchr0014g46617 [Zizania palustris]|uniref:Uncharacterized protein n=1 Tax=Zizania palustris TaxID=103762 RepID=A0A8J5T9Q5_ZIZPA|nr:hypothetical protein GUJ93_ZPchr0014g46617 [Zizania palustris]